MDLFFSANFGTFNFFGGRIGDGSRCCLITSHAKQPPWRRIGGDFFFEESVGDGRELAELGADKES